MQMMLKMLEKGALEVVKEDFFFFFFFFFSLSQTSEVFFSLAPLH